jgi:MYXO-CTERM domain-containing protein
MACSVLRAAACFLLAILGAPLAVPAVNLASGDIVVLDAGSVGVDPAPPRVIRVDPQTGAQTLISEGGLLEEPVAIAVEPAGTLLVSDSAAGAILRIDPGTGGQTVVSGSFGGLLALALEPATGDILATDASEATVLRVAPQSGAKSSFASGALLTLPQAIAVAPSGVSYIASFSDAWRLVRIPAGGGAPVSLALGFGFPSGVAVDVASGAVWVADTTEGAIVRVDPGTGAKTTVASGGELLFPFGVAAYGSQILVTDWGDDGVAPAVIRVNPGSGAQSVVSDADLLREPWAVAVVPESDSGLLGLAVAAALGFLRRRAKPTPASAQTIATAQAGAPGSGTGKSEIISL